MSQFEGSENCGHSYRSYPAVKIGYGWFLELGKILEKVAEENGLSMINQYLLVFFNY